MNCQLALLSRPKWFLSSFFSSLSLSWRWRKMNSLLVSTSSVIYSIRCRIGQIWFAILLLVFVVQYVYVKCFFFLFHLNKNNKPSSRLKIWMRTDGRGSKKLKFYSNFYQLLFWCLVRSTVALQYFLRATHSAQRAMDWKLTRAKGRRVIMMEET